MDNFGVTKMYADLTKPNDIHLHSYAQFVNDKPENKTLVIDKTPLYKVSPSDIIVEV